MGSDKAGGGEGGVCVCAEIKKDPELRALP